MRSATAIGDGKPPPIATLCCVNVIQSESNLNGQTLVGLDFTAQRATDVMFSRCSLTNSVFARTQLHKLDLSQSTVSECDLANAVWEAARLEKVELKHCRMTGLNLTQALLKDSVFQGCEASLSTFRTATFRKVRFVDCNLQDADFQRADLRQAVFENCNLRRAQFSFAKLDGTDFRGCAIEEIQVGVEHLRGAVVDPTQAAYLASLMGIKVVY